MRILLTGATGFIAGHTIVELLKHGHIVRGTVRDLDRAEGVRSLAAAAGAPTDKLSFARAELLSDEGWDEAIAGCDAVCHMASPFPIAEPRHADELIRPAVDGTRRVLDLARAEGASRVVVTSSLAAVCYGKSAGDTPPYDESDWTDPDAPDVGAYVRSKTLAERAAWEMANAQPGALRLSTVNPGLVLGPLLTPEHGASVGLIANLLSGAMPLAPRLSPNIVDVRDVARLHRLALESDEAVGQRYCATAGVMSVAEMGRALRAALPKEARRAPVREAPDFLIRLAGKFDPTARAAAHELGVDRRAVSDKARRELDWTTISPTDALIATAQSLVAFSKV